MPQQPQRRDSTERYTFRFDAPIKRRVFGDRYDLNGWLVHSGGESITGIRAVVRRPLRRRKIFSARRKRSRPDLAAAFPHLPEAKTSGFLLELRLGLGRNYLTLQVRDEQRVWHTFHTAAISAYPLLLLDKLRFHRLRQFLISYLARRYCGFRKVYSAPRNHSSFSSPVPQRPAISRIDLFATTKSNLFILEIGELLAAGFRELGCDSRLLLDQLPAKNPSPDTLQIVVTPHEYYNLFLTGRVPSEEAVELTRNVVLYCTEQPETGWFYNNLPWATKAKAVADINPLGVAAYQEHGIQSYHFQLGYHDILAAPNPKAYDSRPVDITFLGSLTPRRDGFFAQHAPFFAAHRCRLRFVPLGFAKTKTTRSYLSPERRNELLSQSRLSLNVHYSERRYFEWHRALVGFANGSCVVSETSEGYGELVPGKHFIMADREDLIACCDYYLANPKEAEAIAREGSDFVRTQGRQALMCRNFLLQLESGNTRPSPSSLPVCHDVEPSPLPRILSHTLRKGRVQELKDAVTDDLKHLLRGMKPEASNSLPPEPEIPSRSFMIGKREAYRGRLLEQESTRAKGKSVWDLCDNTAYLESVVPKLSIAVTLFNYANHIRECLTSIEQAAEQLLAPIEIVIVNDASTDDSLAHARSHQESSKHPIRVVSKHFNTGLADARNIAVAMARAPYVFMMDADNLVFPECLSQLLNAVDRDNYAAAFSLLCRFRGAPSNRIGLISYFDWDPQILVQQPYIDAMAMFRRDALLQLGGYDNQLSQIGWFGWEDYDMWLRFAQNDYAVAFVPNILCLYRHHDRSMINLTNLFESELVEHFLSRYGDLVAQFEPRETLFGMAREKISRRTVAPP
jgi:GT2 family glycosyltransferase